MPRFIEHNNIAVKLEYNSHRNFKIVVVNMRSIHFKHKGIEITGFLQIPAYSTSTIKCYIDIDFVFVIAETML